MTMHYELSDCKGYPTITLYAAQDIQKRYGFIFGLSKARLILENLEAIREFVKANTRTEPKQK